MTVPTPPAGPQDPARSESQTAREPVDALIFAWRQFYPHAESGRPGNAGARAALRRAATPEAVMLEPAFHDLLLAMAGEGCDLSGFGERRYRRLARIAALLAQRRSTESGSKRFLQVLGGSSDTDKRVLSTSRFQALMAALERAADGANADVDAEAEALTALRRAMLAAKDLPFNIKGFVRDLWTWNDSTAIRWTFDYFGRSYRAAPSTTTGRGPTTTSEETE